MKNKFALQKSRTNYFLFSFKNVILFQKFHDKKMLIKKKLLLSFSLSTIPTKINSRNKFVSLSFYFILKISYIVCCKLYKEKWRAPSFLSIWYFTINFHANEFNIHVQGSKRKRPRPLVLYYFFLFLTLFLDEITSRGSSFEFPRRVTCKHDIYRQFSLGPSTILYSHFVVQRSFTLERYSI